MNEIVVRGTLVSADKAPIHNGAVVIHDNQIIDIGAYKQIKKDYSCNEIIGNENSIVIPGFINTHTHAVQTFFRGAADDRELLPWLNEVILPGEGTLTKEELYASCELGYAEMISSGITTTNDMLTAHHSEFGFKAAEKSGIRARIGKMLMDRNVPDSLIGDTDDVMEEARKLADMYPAGGKIQYSFTPRFIIASSDRMMRESSIEAKERGLMFHTHAAENISEGEVVKQLTGNSYIQAMHDLNTLGDHSILAHCVHTSNRERELLKKTGTHISHNPSSNSKLASGIAPIPEYLDMGIPIGLASDGSPATGGHNMFFEMRLASFLQKATRKQPKIMPAKTMFEMATIGGAKALNLNNVGLLEVGYKADIVVINTEQYNAYPIYDPISYIVYTADPSSISDVIIDGKIRIRNNKLQYDIKKSQEIAKKYAIEKPFITRN